MTWHYPFREQKCPVPSDRIEEGLDDYLRRMWNAVYSVSVLYVEPASELVSQATT